MLCAAPKNYGSSDARAEDSEDPVMTPARLRGQQSLTLERHDSLAAKIQAVLESDVATGAKLMQPPYRARAIKQGSLSGYCPVASAAYFFLGGGREAGPQPMQLTHRGGSPLVDREEWPTMIDLSLRPGRERRELPPYQHGSPAGSCRPGTNARRNGPKSCASRNTYAESGSAKAAVCC